MSTIVASAATIGGIDDATVIPANVAAQIHVTSAVVEPNGSLLITSADCSALANSRTNGLPIRTPVSATRKIPALLSGCAHRSTNDELNVNVRTVSTKNVATDPISRVRRRPCDPPGHQRGDGDHQRDQCSKTEGNVTD